MEQIGWLAGIVEGEGCLHLAKEGQILVKITMTDIDVIQRVGDALGKSVTVKTRAKPLKDAYSVRVWGQAAANLLADIYHQLGERRKAKALLLLKIFASKHRDSLLCINGHRAFPGDYYADKARKSGRGRCKKCIQRRVLLMESNVA